MTEERDNLELEPVVFFGKQWGAELEELAQSAGEANSISENSTGSAVDSPQPEPTRASQSKNANGFCGSNMLGLAINSENWSSFARCLELNEADKDLFFSPGQGKEHQEVRRDRVRAAKAICAMCDVREYCEDYGLGLHLREGGIEGVFGGLDENDRRRVLRRRNS